MKRCQILTTWRISYQLHSQLRSPCLCQFAYYGDIAESLNQYQFTLDGFALWRQKWSSQLYDAVIPQTAAEGLAACNQQAFPLIRTFLTIFLTLSVSAASAERSFSTLRTLKTWIRSRMCEERLTGLAILHVHSEVA